MSTTISGFTQAANQAQQWVNELATELGWGDRQAHLLLRTVLHAVRDWLSTEEMADLSAQLPTLVRGMYFEGWQPRQSPARDRQTKDFIRRVVDGMASEACDDPERAVSAVFQLLDRHLDSGELQQVRNSMKKGLRQLWPTH